MQIRHERRLPATRLETYACKTAFNVLNPLRWLNRRSPIGMQIHTVRARRIDSEKSSAAY
jgi:hypothetical protein